MFPLPLAPPCSQYGFTTGGYSLRQDNAGTLIGGQQTFFSSTGPTTVGGRAVSVFDDNVHKLLGNVSGGIQGRNIDFTITWDGGPNVVPSHFTGTVGDDGLVHRGVVTGGGYGPRGWDSINGPLGCIDAPPPAAPAPKPAAGLPGEVTSLPGNGILSPGPTLAPQAP
jgi:hypothetical protein